MLATRTARQPAAEAEFDPTPRPVRLLVKDRSRGFQEEWHFTLDPRRIETHEERLARYLADERFVHMGGIHAISGRAYSFIKRLNSTANDRRRAMREKSPIDERAYDQLIMRRIRAEESGNVDLVDEISREVRELDARRDRSPNADLLRVLGTQLLLALPEPMDDGASPLWQAGDIFAYSRRVKWLDRWYEPEKKNPPGRKPGTKNRQK